MEKVDMTVIREQELLENKSENAPKDSYWTGAYAVGDEVILSVEENKYKATDIYI